MIAPLDGTGGLFGPEARVAVVRDTDDHNPVDRMVVVENTHNRGGGTPWSLEGFESIATKYPNGTRTVACPRTGELYDFKDLARAFIA